MNDDYKKGWGAASTYKSVKDCPFGPVRMVRRSYWLAGWHDYHIKKKTGVYE